MLIHADSGVKVSEDTKPRFGCKDKSVEVEIRRSFMMILAGALFRIAFQSPENGQI